MLKSFNYLFISRKSSTFALSKDKNIIQQIKNNNYGQENFFEVYDKVEQNW